MCRGWVARPPEVELERIWRHGGATELTTRIERDLG
jgi:hypothetical protein